MRHNFIQFIGLLVLIAGMLSMPLTLFGQATDATIAGLVKDAAGSPLPGATVTIKNESTGFRTGTQTGVDGRFSIKQLPLGGPYTVTFSFIGFTNQTRTGYQLNQADLVSINVTLAESDQNLQEVVVKETGLKSRIDRLGATTAITADNIAKLPVFNRSFTNLIALSPSVTASAWAASFHHRPTT
ncbi:carboxypeptidase regulatory-like domain-containing protein [Spirosoma montaniterrae]|uniref:carboxypeptidase regulatory-like domain-containing protein n=1 Tax=Spirosoma montaniterrae TaxID=1178516 RepID=UPI001E4D1481|nr:carboxypeptidase regulatory-like domain-containing protein [Spirosoma montaniterrae]